MYNTNAFYNPDPDQVIRIIDGPMGSFKTTTAMKRMQDVDSRCLYVAPLLTETSRIVDGCSNANFTEPTSVYNPETKKMITKSESLMTMLRMGMNVAISHSLFLRITPAMLKVCRDQGYSLILDETPEVATVVNVPSSAQDFLFGTKQLAKGHALNAQRTICMVNVGSDDTGCLLNGRIDGISVRRMVALARSGRLQLVHDHCFVKTQPPELITSFKEVTVLTFMFKGSVFQSWLDIHHLNYELCSITKGPDHQIAPFTPEHEWGFKCKTKALLEVNVERKLNRIGEKRSHLTKGEKNPLTSSWWKDTKELVLDKQDEIKRKLTNFFRSRSLPETTYDHNMWTCLKEHKRALVGNGHAMKCWLPANARATNSLRHKANLAYMMNVYPQMGLEFYFREMGVPVDKDAYAISQLLQWIFRSRIRVDQPVALFLPAKRMKDLLHEYLILGNTAVPYTPTAIKQAA